jgi:excisionase family DNA binding protein
MTTKQKIRLFTTSEAAEYLEVTPSRIRQLIMEKRIDSVKYGRDHIIKEMDLNKYLINGKKKKGRPVKTK